MTADFLAILILILTVCVWEIANPLPPFTQNQFGMHSFIKNDLLSLLGQDSNGLSVVEL